MSTPPLPPPIRSSFVSVVAWTFTILASLATLILWPDARQQIPMQGAPLDTPSSFYWVVDHSAWLFHIFWLHAIITLIAAIGLLRRNEWGRRLFIGTLAVVILYAIIFVTMEWWWSSSMPRMMLEMSGGSGEIPKQMSGFVWYIRVFSLLYGLSWSVLFGWIIKRLGSMPIHREFSPVNASPTFPDNSP